LKILVINTKVERSTKEIVSKVRMNKENNESLIMKKMEKLQECTEKCLNLFEDYDQEKGNVVLGVNFKNKNSH
jgi:mevalonate kinase